MDPGSWIAIAGLVTSVVGAGLSAKGASDAAGAEAAAAKANADALREQAGVEESRIRRMNRVELARERATLAKSGVRLEGTPLDQIVRNAGELEQNAINARRGLLRSADLQGMTARSALSTGRTASLGYLFAGGSAALGQYAQYSLLRKKPSPNFGNVVGGSSSTAGKP